MISHIIFFLSLMISHIIPFLSLMIFHIILFLLISQIFLSFSHIIFFYFLFRSCMKITIIYFLTNMHQKCGTPPIG
ncbi:hypothetical protein GLOIN_2v1737149 [Rhizophagus irregularis DAOM 181602=DAOM 197198]|uniref:Uncharacterized protein n=1 Tax=Rhizophagus irregularis (strain DAOM 181602 / DAOM 197198 / MUCL 43194) TaxID=747089 RepID=A0A2P4NXA8_RHIID|nr:hypothetical protein GLOIN_2v1737149 [Rhizophagus irregularis DAOM 181602=DAOM 197198]POG57764.1 hypothetical protein GLOIN_2v1737149 [Rhizophagus irregularis DAOM 181602=DAOM 197198]GET54290.1 hypothetical protein GLOIN_2v1737149 [Rhizophagus irregularis DAOM 181602=DAOM 197198]|eukprot:XP_025164630.1 hypothetical protein GLOIN_2v1737149 [Rhizophagus irregularis DAOM 181602=DAOM 197198]